MKKCFLLLALGAICFASLAQTTVLTPHFTDESRKIVIPKEATVFPDIHEGLIALSVYPRMLYVKTTGEYVFGTDFPFVRSSDYHSAYFSGGALMAWRNTGGYSKSPVIVYPDGRYRDLPTNVRNASGMSYDILAASDFLDGYAVVRKGDLMSSTQLFIDKNGKEVFPALRSKQRGMMGDMTIYPVRENRRVYYNAELQKYGYADAQGNIAIKPQFDKALDFSEGMAAVMIKENYTEKWGFIDTTGKLVIPATYRLEPGRFSEGRAAVRIGESAYDCVMNYIDKTGKRLMPESQPWNLNEFHDGYAWAGTGCDKLFVMNREFVETRNVTADFYHNGNGMGVCSFSMLTGHVQNKRWGFDFPGGVQMLNQGGETDGDIFAPDGTLLYTCVDAKGNRVNLHHPTEGDLMFCEVRMTGEPRLKVESLMLNCFINKKGEIVYYFVEGYEGYEGPTPVQVK